MLIDYFVEDFVRNGADVFQSIAFFFVGSADVFQLTAFEFTFHKAVHLMVSNHIVADRIAQIHRLMYDEV
jgi:hypothetical protein